jgi:hypothetical protein
VIAYKIALHVNKRMMAKFAHGHSSMLVFARGHYSSLILSTDTL